MNDHEPTDEEIKGVVAEAERNFRSNPTFQSKLMGHDEQLLYQQQQQKTMFYSFLFILFINIYFNFFYLLY